jgi:4-amino-4-deoxy-L-arabinose transferase-like glycosyltransferase
MPRADYVEPKGATLVAALILGQVVLWTLAPALTHTAPPLDVVESYMWGRELPIATYKHPAMPGWILEASYQLTGAVGWPAYLVSQLFIAATFLFVFLLGRDLMGSERAAAGTLLLTGVSYYTWWTPEFNHNIAQMPFCAALPWALWRAVETRALRWWVLAALFGAASLYAKLSGAFLLLGAATWILADQRARATLTTPGPWIALVVFLVLTMPLASWMLAHDFLPLQYGTGRSLHARGIPRFLGAMLLNLSVLFGMIAVAGLIGPRSRNTAKNGPATFEQVLPGLRERDFLLIFILGPLAFAMLAAVIGGRGLQTAWGSAMFAFAGLLAILLTSARFNRRALKRIAACAAVLVIALPAVYAMVVGLGPRIWGVTARVHWPQAEIANRFGAIWAGETGRPLRIVGGDSWIAGLVGLTSKDRPSIFSDGRFVRSPWITPARIETEGMLIVWDARWPPPLELRSQLATHLTREEVFRWPQARNHPPIRIGYAVFPPQRVKP